MPTYPAFKTLVAFLQSEFTFFLCVFATILYNALKNTRRAKAPYIQDAVSSLQYPKDAETTRPRLKCYM